MRFRRKPPGIDGLVDGGAEVNVCLGADCQGQLRTGRERPRSLILHPVGAGRLWGHGCNSGQSGLAEGAICACSVSSRVRNGPSDRRALVLTAGYVAYGFVVAVFQGLAVTVWNDWEAKFG